MIRVFRSEWRKLRRPTLFGGTLGIVFALSVFITSLLFLLLDSDGGNGPRGRVITRETLALPNGLYLGFTNVAGSLGTIALSVFAAQTALEYTNGTLRNLLVRQPKRLVLLAGKYIFELSVTDNDGNVKKDTTQLNILATNRQVMQARLTPVGSLSEKRKVSGVAFLGNKIFLAGGRYPPAGPGPNFTSRVDIYDVITKDWTTTELSQKKWGVAAAVAGNKVFFGGGTALQGNASPTTRVDMYDIVEQKWSITELPKPGQYTAIAQGNKVLFAGGTAVYMYDYLSEKWSTKNLSQPRVSIAATSVGGSIYLSGGATSNIGGTPFNNIDIYDPKTNSWIVSSMSKAKYAIASIGLRGKALWAGGVTDKGLTNEIEMLDLLGGKGTTFHCLFQPGSFSTNSMGKLGNYIVFLPDSGDDKTRFDIYDSLNDKWYIGVLDKKIGPAILITAGSELYVVGSSTPGIDYYDQLWKLDF